MVVPTLIKQRMMVALVLEAVTMIEVVELLFLDKVMMVEALQVLIMVVEEEEKVVQVATQVQMVEQVVLA